MRTHILVVSMIAGLTAVSGWSTVEAAGTGTIYVNRGSSLVGYFGSYDISVDGKVLGSIGNDSCTRLQVPAGKRTVGSPNFFGTIRDGATVSVPSGGHVYVMLSPRIEYPGPVSWAAVNVIPRGRRC
jgi:hypothetical protein